jgi:hypothetical protein
MRRIPTFLDIIISATLLVVGLYLLYEGSLGKSTNEAATLIAGAVSFTLGLMTLISAVTSILWHRDMLRHGMPNHPPETAASEPKRGLREDADFTS